MWPFKSKTIAKNGDLTCDGTHHSWSSSKTGVVSQKGAY
jgi:hypothetical protein